MEPHSNLRLLFISLCLVIFVNSARSQLSPDASPAPQPVTSSISASPSASPAPSPSPSEDFSPEMVQVSLSSLEVVPESILTRVPIQRKKVPGAAFTSDLHAVSVDPEVKKICDQTDHASLCLATILPNMKEKPNVDSVLKVAVEAGSEYAKEALAEATKLASKPGTPDDLLMTLKDCKDGYDSAAENFQKTLDAFASNDIGTMRSVLSAVFTLVGDCQDQFQEMQIESPLTGYAQKLTEMTSNCLAITDLLMN